MAAIKREEGRLNMDVIKWIKMGKTVNKDGSTITYAYGNTGFTVESRKRHIPHANGYAGTWDHTSYFVLEDGKDLSEKSTLKDAQRAVEEIIKFRED